MKIKLFLFEFRCLEEIGLAKDGDCLLLVTSLHDARDRALTDVLGQLVDLVVPVNLNRLTRGVDKDFAVVTFAQV